MNDATHKPRVLVTRPKHQQSNFIQLCTEANIETVSLPCIDILPVECTITSANVAQAELIFFTSRNAVEFAHAQLPLPWSANVFAVGRATERALTKLNQTLVHPPIAPYNSEAFLNWHESQPAINSALIVKGLGGRDLIEKQLSAKGVNVDIKSVYKRITPVVSDAQRHRVFIETPPQIISVTSDVVLRNLVNIAGKEFAAQLHATPLVVNSERCAQLAVKLGFDLAPIVANPPGDAGQLEAIQKHLTINLNHHIR